MAGRRLLYLVTLAGCLVLYVFYREWLAWLLLMAVVCLPLGSLLISLPAMCMVKTSLNCPTEVSVGQSVRPELARKCRLPAPPVRCRIRLRRAMTGETSTWKPGKLLLADHCGVLELTPRRLWVYDYLGLWRFPGGKKEPRLLTVLPVPVEPEILPHPNRYTAAGWRPRPGGGFSENHDLRLYRPGDDLRNIHWKLSSKTGKLIYREPVVPLRKRLTVTLELSGDPHQIDSKLGRLLWTSEHLLSQGVTHEVRCLTGRGVEAYRVADRESQRVMPRALLAAPVCPADKQLSAVPGAFHIGGGSHEA